MEIRYSEQTIELSGKVLTGLDRFVLDFLRILEGKTSYVIVSGYVAILFGRSRGTEDIDILIPALDADAFRDLHQSLLEGEFEFLNAEDASGLPDMLGKGMGIRIAKKGRFIPNIELRFLKGVVDSYVFQNRTRVLIPDASLYISPIDVQIAYKIYLGSDKDIEDAVYLWEIFREDLDQNSLKSWMQKFGVNGEEYGICI